MNWMRTLGILVTILATACAPAAAPVTPTSAPAGNDVAQWEKETLQAAQKEGKVVVYGFWNPTLEQMIVGGLIADVIAVIGSIDVVMGDVDR